MTHGELPNESNRSIENLREQFFLPSGVLDNSSLDIPGANKNELELLESLIVRKNSFRGFSIYGDETEDEKISVVSKVCEKNGIDLVVGRFRNYPIHNYAQGSDRVLRSFIDEAYQVDSNKPLMIVLAGLQNYLIRVNEGAEKQYEDREYDYRKGAFHRSLAEVISNSLYIYPKLMLCSPIIGISKTLPSSFLSDGVFTEFSEINKPNKSARKKLILATIAEHELDEVYRGYNGIFDAEEDVEFVHRIVKSTKNKSTQEIKDAILRALNNFKDGVYEYQNSSDQSVPNENVPSITMRNLWQLVCLSPK